MSTNQKKRNTRKSNKDESNKTKGIRRYAR